MGRPSRFSPEVRERAVRMVEEHQEARIRAQELRDLWRAHGSIESIGFQD